MPTARKTKTGKAGKAIYGRPATAAEQARFKRFARDDVKRDESRLAADVEALRKFVTILKSGKDFPKPVEVVMAATKTARSGGGAKKPSSATKRVAKRHAKAAAAGIKG
ncbi:hypothetical protein [Paraburkholderia largidicola]|uniref:Uncharacterized protein n=1 Tax=Paraburkholderia largidicola TaxID=3014751 RepID=A0A7I8BK37_9BURK|nr:hypothetical protein [Paraburkholderia sp. PGU16]BCF89096.1 hypothetical protein PPGU16_21630 [Paraburkholderia sp. PGU16]